jgi:DNA invertase Pin-like site-specific DNA recombinase
VSVRFAFYGRLSTTDKQDPALSFPSQLKACQRKAEELGGAIACEFTDQESGAKQDRPGWAALTAEARDVDGRRFDAVLIYSTSRLARDRLYAALFERELQHVGVAIHYATGAGDPTTPEGSLFIGMQQLWDEFERSKLRRETKRGMREGSEQGYRMGGRAQYGYRREEQALPEDHQGDRSKSRVKLVPVPEQAIVVAEIFHLHADRGLGFKAIAEHLNRPGGPPPPSHVDSRRNLRGHWSANTVRAMLLNPVYTGRMVWNRLDFATARETGRRPKLRAREEWVVSEEAHLPLVSDELFARSQARFDGRKRSRQAANGNGGASRYLFAGMVHCATGHQPLSMQGKARKEHHYYACSYAAGYGDTAAVEAHAGQKWIYLREDALLPVVLRFFEQRIFGPLRLEKLNRQLRAHDRAQRGKARATGTRLRQLIADTDRRIKAQVEALEAGVDPELVSTRIAELKNDKATFEADLAQLSPGEQETEADDLAGRLDRLPNLADQLRDAPRETQRQTFEAFDLEISFDKAERRIEVSATVTEAVAQAFENTKALRDGGLPVTVCDIAGAGFEHISPTLAYRFVEVVQLRP